MSQGHHLLLLKLMTNEFWKVASRAALIRTVRGKLSVWNANWDAKLNNVCLAMTLKSARLTTFPIWCNLLSLLVKMHATATACIVCHVATMKPCLSHSSSRETYFSPCLYPTSNLSLHCVGGLPKHHAPAQSHFGERRWWSHTLYPGFRPLFFGIFTAGKEPAEAE